MNVPHDDELESALLGAAMRDVDALTVLMKLNAQDFYKPIHSEAFRAIVHLADESSPVTLATVSSRLRETRLLEVVGGTAALTDWLGKSCGSQPAFYAEKLRDLSARRQLIELSAKIIEGAANEEESIDTVLDRATTGLQAITSGDVEDVETFEAGMRRTLDKITDGVQNGKPPVEISTGISKLDYWTCGLHREELTVIAGRTSAGKTSFAVQIACHVAKRHGSVLLFSLEMPRDEIHKRIYALETSVEMQAIRQWTLNDTDLYVLERAFQRLKSANLRIDDTSDVSLRTVRTKARQIRTAPALIVVDYLQIMRLAGVKNENRTRELDEASRTLKLIARDFKCPVIALSQVNRAVGMSEDKRPSLDNLRESGGIANNADNVLFVHSAAYDEKPGAALPDVVDAEIIIAKQRNGPRNVKVAVRWRPAHVRFEEKADGYEDPFKDDEFSTTTARRVDLDGPTDATAQVFEEVNR